MWHGRNATDLPSRKIGRLDPEVFASYSGPDVGLTTVHNLEAEKGKFPTPGNGGDQIAGAPYWNKKSRKAYGISLSLYDQHPINGKISGQCHICDFQILA